jgi:hypothetical protein
MPLLPIPSTIPTSSFYQLALQALYDIAGAEGGGGGGGVVTNAGIFPVQNTTPIPAGSNVIGGVNLPTSATSSITSFTSTSSAQVLPANASRKGVVLYNQGAGTCFVLLGAGTTSASANSVGLGTSDAVTITGWTGAIQGIFLTAGTLSVTELL